MNPLSLMVGGVSVNYARRKLNSDALGVFRRSKVEQVKALEQVSFSAFEGEIIGVMGANGAGKSTLFNVLANRVAYEGTIRLWSEPRLIKLERSLPLVFSGRQHIELLVSSLIKDADEAEELIESAIEFSGLGSAIDASMRSYSKGMRSRVTFSALTVGRPRVILIDEALAVGDRDFARKAMARIRELSTQSSTILICDHNLVRLRRLCSRGIVFESGSILTDAPIEKAISRHETLASDADLSNKRSEPGILISS